MSDHVKDGCPCFSCRPIGYEELARVLRLALDQAAHGKGKERHASPGVPFLEQPIITEGLELKSIDFQIGQARKKALEATRLPPKQAITDLLGAINYLAAAVILVEKK